MRALSPGTKDTTTAIMCVDYLTAIPARLAARNIPSSHPYELSVRTGKRFNLKNGLFEPAFMLFELHRQLNCILRFWR